MQENYGYAWMVAKERRDFPWQAVIRACLILPVIVLAAFFFISHNAGAGAMDKPDQSSTVEFCLPPEEEEDEATLLSPSCQPVVLVLNRIDEPDLILTSYGDPSLKEWVIAFFSDLSDSREVAEAVLSNAAANEIPPALAFALCAEESSYSPRAYNRNRNNTVDRGLFQLNSASFPNLKTDDFYDIKTNARYGLAHLRLCLKTESTVVAALAMYNAGHGRVNSEGTPKSTLNYISRILERQRRIEESFVIEYSGFAFQPP